MLKLFVGDPKRGGLAVARATALIIHRIITIITITVSHPPSLSLSISLSSFLLFSPLGGGAQGIHLRFDPATCNLHVSRRVLSPRVR